MAVGVLGQHGDVPLRQVQHRKHWWEGRQGHNRVLIAVFAGVAVLAIFYGAILKWTDGDQRQVVVTMQQGITQADRVTVRDTCGALPGIRPVADKGDPALQYRFPVRFDVGGSSTAQESALYACVQQFAPRFVRGVQTENDDT
jgi:hypothetical protein